MFWHNLSQIAWRTFMVSMVLIVALIGFVAVTHEPPPPMARIVNSGVPIDPVARYFCGPDDETARMYYVTSNGERLGPYATDDPC